ncbi:MAG: glycosyltransferase, partial [Siculibacillus sp.]
MSNSKNLNLLLTTRATGDGGAERVWVTIARRFAERGDRVTLAVDIDEPSFGLTADTNPALVRLGRSHLASTFALTRLLKTLRPDVALAAVSGSCTKLVAAAAMARTGTPLVLSYHGFEEWRTGRLAAAAFYGMPIANRAASRIVAVSDGLRERLVQSWGAEAAKTLRIYNPVSTDLDAAAASAADLATRAPMVLAVGRLSPEKGMADLLAAFARVERPEARLTIAGDGPERAMLEARARELGIAERVTFAGHVDPTPFYRRARMVAVPSRTEAFGLVLVEALAHGLPVAATACHGPLEILGGGRWG